MCCRKRQRIVFFDKSALVFELQSSFRLDACHTLTDSNYRTAVAVIIKASTDGKPQHEAVLRVGQTPELLIKYGLPELDLVITGRTIDKSVFDHGISKGVIERLHTLISSPKTLYRSAPPHTNGSVVVTLEMHRQCPVIIPIRANKQFGRDRFVNEITSVYAKEGGNFEQRWRSEGLLLWDVQINNP